MSYTRTVVDFVREYPGLDGKQLRRRGYQPEIHGSLQEAMVARAIDCDHGKWYIAPHGTERADEEREGRARAKRRAFAIEMLGKMRDRGLVVHQLDWQTIRLQGDFSELDLAVVEALRHTGGIPSDR